MPLPRNSAEAAKSVQNYGQQQYRQSNYIEALEAFNKALELAPHDRVGILDNRAATYCRLEVPDYKKAFSDASRMIREAKADARGYLRAGKVLHLSNEPARAMAIYEYGLKAVHVDCPEREVLSELLQKLDRRVNGPKLLDPFQDFPDEIVSMVLSYLDTKSLLASSRVSQLWRGLLCSMHWLWRHLDLSIARKRVVPKRVLRLIALSKSSIRKATLHNVYVDDIQLYSDALLTCRDLREISLKYVAPAGVSINMRQPNVREFLASTKEYDEQIVQFRKIVEGCPHLRVAKVSFSDRPHCAPFTMPYMPHLQSFHCVVRSDAEMPRLVFRMMDDHSETKPSTPHWEEICLMGVIMPVPIDLSKCSKLRVLSFANCLIPPSQQLPETLEHLSFTSTSPPDLSQYSLPNLRTICLVSIREIYPQLSHLLLHCRDRLETLSVKESIPDNPSQIAAIFPSANYLPKLKELNLQGIFEVNDTVVRKVITSAPNLKRLNLSATSVTGHGIRMLARSDDFKLEQLVINELLQRPDGEDIHFARNSGINIPPIRHQHM